MIHKTKNIDMKKLLGIVVLSLLFSGNGNSETISQRLDKIEKRVEIEESLDGSKFLQELMGEKLNLIQFQLLLLQNLDLN